MLGLRSEKRKVKNENNKDRQAAYGSPLSSLHFRFSFFLFHFPFDLVCSQPIVAHIYAHVDTDALQR